MSGSLYTGKTTFREWKKKSYELSIINKLKNQGFRTTAYSIRNSTGNPFADSNNIMSSISPLFAVDLWLLRLVPAILRQEVFYNGEGIITKNWGNIFNVPSGDFRSYVSYSQFKKMITDEANRKNFGEYVFAHFNQPHKPNQLNRYGVFVGESSYLESSYLATNMMADFIKMLKETGRFNSSLIIFQSDHGTTKKLTTYPKISKSDLEKIRTVDVHGWNGRKIDHRTRALLLVKLPNAKDNKLKFNTNLVQLLDIPKLINHVAKTPNTNSYQINNLLKKNRVPIYHIWKQKKGVIGKDIRSGQYNYYTVTKNNKWKVHDNIDFKY